MWKDKTMGSPPLSLNPNKQGIKVWLTSNGYVSLFDLSEWMESGLWKD